MDKRALAEKIIEKALPNVPFEGWSEPVLDQAGMACGLQRGEYVRIFPKGMMDVLRLWSEMADDAMRERAATLDLPSLKIRERIAALVKLRLSYYAPHKEALRKAYNIYLQPWHLYAGMQTLSKTSDMIWKLAGDRSTDFNWYSKRLLLAGVYASTFTYWLDDTSENHARSWEFLARRIENVMQLGRVLPFNKKPRPT